MSPKLERVFSSETPLMNAAKNGHLEIVELLSFHKADVYSLDDDGKIASLQ